jgi:hypothetical protein
MPRPQFRHSPHTRSCNSWITWFDRFRCFFGYLRILYVDAFASLLPLKVPSSFTSNALYDNLHAPSLTVKTSSQTPTPLHPYFAHPRPPSSPRGAMVCIKLLKVFVVMREETLVRWVDI